MRRSSSAVGVSRQRPFVLVLLENAVLAISLAGALLVLTLLILPSNDYASISIEEVKPMKATYLLFGSETYLVFRLTDEYDEKLEKLANRGRRVGVKTIDPPMSHQQVDLFRVFSVHEYNGFIMLPARKWWQNTVPCDDLDVQSDTIVQNGVTLHGAIVCRRSISQWWPGDKRVIYDLDGFSRTTSLANLYVPHYHIYNGVVHIGSAHEH